MKDIESSIVKLYKLYEAKPILRALIQAITYYELPIGSVGDSILNTYVNNLRAEKIRTFFEELNKGELELTEDVIKNNDFLHSYFSTINYVLRNRSDLKIVAFAKILKSLYHHNISIDEFEDYVKIFDELSEREFLILSIKHNFEKHAATLQNEWNPAQRTSSYWKDFKKEIKEKLSIDTAELNAMLIRIQRTGCYMKHTGYWDSSHEEEGDTTAHLQTIINIVQFNEPELPTF